MSSENKKVNVHEEHRKRTKDTILEKGTGHLQPHQLLEALLFYSIPRKDVNGLAHELIRQFGDVRGVLDADPVELQNVDGVGRNTAVLLKLVQAVSTRYSDEIKNTLSDDKNNKYNSPDKIKPLAVKLFENELYEKSFVLSFNSKFAFLGSDLLSEGDHHSTLISKQKVVEIAARRRATFIALAHNHPDGDVNPSQDDIRTTRELKNALEQVDYHLIEHIIVSAGRTFAFSENGIL